MSHHSVRVTTTLCTLHTLQKVVPACILTSRVVFVQKLFHIKQFQLVYLQVGQYLFKNSYIESSFSLYTYRSGSICSKTLRQKVVPACTLTGRVVFVQRLVHRKQFQLVYLQVKQYLFKDFYIESSSSLYTYRSGNIFLITVKYSCVESRVVYVRHYSFDYSIVTPLSKVFRQ